MPAPDFTLKDTDGASITLSALKGRVVVVEFWATWCPPCKESIPGLNDLYGKYKDKNFSLYAISVDEGSNIADDVKSFKAQNGILYPVLLNDKTADGDYDISSIPVSFIIDKNGVIVERHRCYPPGTIDKMKKEIEALL